MNKCIQWTAFFAVVSFAKLNMAQSATNFEQIKTKANYLIENNGQKGNGYNAYKRWEWENETRLDENGNIPLNNPIYEAWLSYSQKMERRSGMSNWSFIGPKTATGGYQGMGRVNCIAFHPTVANTYWVGTPSGGIWKTEDDGLSWTTNFDNEPVLGVSSIVINPNNPDSMYALTGDGDRGSLSGLTGAPRGDNKSLGVVFSSNGGQSWDTTGLNFTYDEVVLGRKLLMNPKNTRILICATLSGIYRTINAGKTWTKTIDDDFIDIAFHPTDNNIVYATTLIFGGGSSFYRSLNNGLSFSKFKHLCQWR